MQIVYEPSLAKFTTLHLGGKAIGLIMPKGMSELEELPDYLKRLGGTPYTLGKGSNLLAREGLLPITFISLREFTNIKILDRHEDKITLEVQSGVPLPRLLRFCLQHNLSGLEGLVGIPGTVGGACAMNAGSFGTVFGDNIKSIQVWTCNGLKTINKSLLNFTYRHCRYSEVSDFTPIVSVIIALTQSEKNGIFRRMNLNFFQKKTRQPILEWSAGCVFKNPPAGPSAGALLEKAGLRGYKQGGLVFSPQHANFLVNEGTGRADIAIEMLEKARWDVEKLFGIKLEYEVQIIP